MKHNFKKLSDTEWLLLRPHNIIGSIQKVKQTGFVLKNDNFVYEDFYIVPGFLKIINEIIDNTVDVYVKSDGKFSTKVEVTMTDTKIKVKDNGSGIPVVKQEGTYIPESAWGEPRAGTNFEDEKNAGQLGMNGVGSYATAVFSKRFVGTTCDGKKKMTVTFTDNLSKRVISTPAPCKTPGTTVEFTPDLEKFGLKTITADYHNIINQRLIHLAFTYPGITFKFNNKIIKVDPKTYFSRFGKDTIVFQGSNYAVAFLPNNTDDFNFLAYTNGLHNFKTGSQIDYFLERALPILRTKIAKKYPSIKQGDIKNKLTMVVIMKGFIRPDFEGQVKEQFTSPASKITEHVGKIDYEKWADIIFKNKKFMEPIIDLYKAKAEIEKQKKIAAADKKPKKKPKSEKFMPPIGIWNNIFLGEGDSATNSVRKVIGRKGNGFYAMFGVPPNAYDMTMEKIIESPKLKDLQNIIGLKFGATKQTNLNFQNIIITADFDLPGHFITGQLLGLFMRFGKNLFEEKRIKRFITPLVVVRDKKEKIVTWFYDFEHYIEFEKKHGNKYTYDYKKGFGSWDQKDLEAVIKKDGLENMLEVYTLDDLAEESIDNWLNGKKTDKRKEMLEGYKFNVLNT